MYCTFSDESQEGVVLFWANKSCNFIHDPVFQNNNTQN